MLPDASLSPVSGNAYWETGRYQLELEKVFRRNWIFAGFASQLNTHESYVTVAYPGLASIVIQNFDGVLKAFRNVCSHRHAELRSEPCGRSPLRCRYHGWTYDEKGDPAGIPNQLQNFGFSDKERLELRLQQFDVAAIGPLIFVRQTGCGPSLREFLGPMAAVLDRMGQTFDLPFENSDQLWNGNWKLGVENTLEEYHVNSCHSESLGLMCQPGGESALVGHHSQTAHKIYEKSIAWWNRALRTTGWKKADGFGDYQHYFIYPNLCIGLTYGSLLSIQTFEPTSPETSRLRFRLCVPKTTPIDAEMESFRVSLTDYFRTYNLGVLDEDRIPVELCQQGCRFAVNRGRLGVNEFRIRHFLECIEDDLAKSDSPARSSHD